MPATDRSLELARAAASAAAEKLATTIVGIDVSEQLAITDIFVIASAETERQVGAIVDEVEDSLRELASKPVRREGQRDGRDDREQHAPPDARPGQPGTPGRGHPPRMQHPRPPRGPRR